MLLVKINGQTLKGFEWFRFSGESPSEGGYPGVGHTQPLVFRLEREMVGAPSILGLRLSTNEDGTLEPITAEIEVLNGRGRTTHAFEIVDGYLESWTYYDEGKKGRGAREVWTLRAAHIKHKVGSEVVSMELPIELVPA